MACTPFKVTVSDVKAALQKVRKGIAEKKGSFNGDEKQGSFSFKGDHWVAGSYSISGTYTVADKAITITNDIQAENPSLVTCKKVEEEMRAWLK